MPVPKGKRRKRPRSKLQRVPTGDVAQHESRGAVQSTGSKPVRRTRRQPPLWMNASLGVVMLVAGVYFTQIAPGGLAIQARLILLVGYLAIAGYYFFKAYRQYRQRAAL